MNTARHAIPRLSPVANEVLQTPCRLRVDSGQKAELCEAQTCPTARARSAHGLTAFLVGHTVILEGVHKLMHIRQTRIQCPDRGHAEHTG